jgi:hypothetical protein
MYGPRKKAQVLIDQLNPRTKQVHLSAFPFLGPPFVVLF